MLVQPTGRPMNNRPADLSPADMRLMTLAEASEATGLTVEALRQRIKRGKLRGLKGNDGLLRVRLAQADIAELQGGRTTSQLVGQPTGQLVDQPVEALLRQQLQHAEERALAAQAVADSRAEALALLHERIGRAEGEAAALRDQLHARQAGAEVTQAELSAWTAGGPIARAWRAFWHRRG
jgi:hypothetical protein